MNCKQVNSLLYDYAEDKLDLKMIMQIENHLNECDKCKFEYKIIKKIQDGCSELNNEYDLPKGFNEDLRKKLMNEKNNRLNIFVQKKYSLAAVILICVLSLSIFVKFNMNNYKSKNTESISNSSSKEYYQNYDMNKESGAVASDSTANSIIYGDYEIKAAKENSKSIEEKYISVTINLNEEQYKKYYDEFDIIIKGMQGYIINKEECLYILSKQNYNLLLNKIINEYKINNILITENLIKPNSEDINLEISALQSKINSTSDSKKIEEYNNNINSLKLDIIKIQGMYNNVYIKINKI